MEDQVKKERNVIKIILKYFSMPYNKLVAMIPQKASDKIYGEVGKKPFIQKFKDFWHSKKKWYVISPLTLGAIGISVAIIISGGDLKKIINIGSQEKYFNATVRASSQNEYGLTRDSNFEIVFDEDENYDIEAVKKSVKIEPFIEYNVETQGKKIIIDPVNELDVDTVYKLYIPKGSKLSENTETNVDLSWVFVTEPKFVVTGTTPRNLSTAPFNTSIEIEFSYYNLDEESVKGKLTTVPAIDGEIKVLGNKIILVPKNNLISGYVYSVNLQPGVKTKSGKIAENGVQFSFSVGSLNSDELTSTSKSFNPSSNCLTHSYWGMTVFNVSKFEYCYYYQENFSGPVHVAMYNANLNDVLTSMRSSKDVGVITTKPREDMSLIWQGNVNKGGSSNYSPYKIVHSVTQKGIYLLEISKTFADGSVAYHYEYFIVTDISGIVHNYNDSSYAYVMSNQNNSFVKGAKVTSLNESFEVIRSLETDNNGYVNFGNQSKTNFAYVEYSGKFAWISPIASDNLYDIDKFAYYQIDSGYKVQPVLDKPYYYPGDEVQIAGYVLKETALAIPNDLENLTLKVYDSNAGLLQTMTVPYDKTYGKFWGKFVIPKTILGYVHVSLFNGDKLLSNISFEVKTNHISSDYSIKLTPINGSFFNNGDTAKFLVEVKYINGDSVLNETFNATFAKYVGGFWNPDLMNDDYGAIVSVGQGNYVEQSEMKVQVLNGKAVVEKQLTCDLLCSYSLTLYASEYSGGSVSVQAKNTNSYIVGKPTKSNYGAGEKATVNFRSFSLWDGKNVGNIPVTLSLVRNYPVPIVTNVYDEETKSTKPVTTYEYRRETVWTGSTVTDNNGKKSLDFQSYGEGSYTLYMILKNNNGADVQIQETLYWVVESSAPSDYTSNSTWINVDVVDSDFKPGSKVKFNIKCNNCISNSAIINIDSSSGNYNSIIKLGQQATLYEYTIPADAVGYIVINVYTLANNPDDVNNEKFWLNGSNGFIVNRDDKKLDVSFEGLKNSYKPGDNVSFNVMVKDSSGAGVNGKLHMEFLDASLINFNEYSWDIESFYYKNNFFVASSLYSNLYDITGYGGAEGSLGMEETGRIRKNFKDVAFWNVDIDIRDGRGVINFTIPDNITSWNVYSVVTTADLKVGMAKASTNVTQEVVVNSQVPNFIHTGDTISVPVYIYNYTKNTVSGDLVSSVSGSCEITNNSTIKINLKSQDAVINFVSIKGNEGSKCTFESTLKNGNNIIDGESKDIPVIANEVVSQNARNLYIKSGKTVSTKFNYYKSDYRSFVSIYVNQSVPTFDFDMTLASTQHAAAYLMYASNKPDSSKDVQNALFVIKNNQDESGCMSWFSYDACDIEATAYTRIALSMIKGSAQIPEGVEEGLNRYLESLIFSDTTDIKYKVMALWALSFERNNRAISVANSIISSDKVKDLSSLELGYLLLTLKNLGMEAAGYDIAIKLSKMGEINNQTALWRDKTSETIVVDNDRYVTAIVSSALNSYLYNDDINKVWEKSVNYLFNTNYDDKKNVKDYFIKTALPEMNISKDAKYKVFVNGNMIGEYTDLVVNIPEDKLSNGENEVKIENTGSGDIYALVSYSTNSFEITQDLVYEVEYFNLTKNQAITQGSNVSVGDMVLVRTKVHPHNDSGRIALTYSVPSGFFTVSNIYISSKWSKEFDRYNVMSKQYSGGKAYLGYITGEGLDQVQMLAYYSSKNLPVVFDQLIICSKGGEMILGQKYANFAGDISIGVKDKGIIVKAK